MVTGSVPMAPRRRDPASSRRRAWLPAACNDARARRIGRTYAGSSDHRTPLTSGLNLIWELVALRLGFLGSCRSRAFSLSLLIPPVRPSVPGTHRTRTVSFARSRLLLARSLARSLRRSREIFCTRVRGFRFCVTPRRDGVVWPHTGERHSAAPELFGCSTTTTTTRATRRLPAAAAAGDVERSLKF